MKKFIICIMAFVLLPLLLSAQEGEQLTYGQFLIKLANSLEIGRPLSPDSTMNDYAVLFEEIGLELPPGFDPDKVIPKAEKGKLLLQAINLESSFREKEIPANREIYRNKAVIHKIVGQAMVKYASEDKWIPAKEGMMLSAADTIKTDKESTAFLKVGLAGYVKVKEDTVLTLETLYTRADNTENIVIYLAAGELIVNVKGISEGSTFETHTPTTLAAVRGTIYSIKIEPLTEKTEINDVKTK